METVLESPTKLNAVQLHLLQMFNFSKSENDLEEFKLILLDFYRKKVDIESERIWNEKNLNNGKMEELLNTHLRTSYK